MILVLILLFSVSDHAQGQVRLPEIEVTAAPVRLRDQVEYQPFQSSLEQPAGNTDLSQSLQRLPGMSVRNASGTGGVITAFPATALNSGAAQLSVDDIPVVNPLGTGFNYSLFPTSLIDGIESRSAFQSAIVPFHDVRPAPGGRINLRVIGEVNPEQSPLSGALSVGSADTAQASAVYRLRSARTPTASEHAFGATGLVSNGDFRFRDTQTKEIERRTHNHTGGFGVVGRSRFQLPGDTSVNAVLIGNRLEHASPGATGFPTPQHQQDTFAMAGATANAPRWFAKLSASHSRNSAKGDPVESPAFNLGASDDRVSAGVAQGGYTFGDPLKLSSTLVIDNEHSRYRGNSGKFFRNVFGATVQGLWRPSGALAITPLVRQEVSSQYSGARDYRVSVLYEFSPRLQMGLGLGYDHLYPDLTAESGYVSPFGLVRANPGLGVERHALIQTSLAANWGAFDLQWQAFYDRVSNRATLQFNNDGTSQYVALPRARLMGTTLDGRVAPLPWLNLRSGVTLLQARDEETKLELPFKPRVQALASAALRIHKRVVLTVEKTYLGRRRYGGTGEANRGTPWLKSFFATSARIDAEIASFKRSPLIAFFRASNLFEKEGEDFPGYPLAGRMFLLGLSFNERPL